MKWVVLTPGTGKRCMAGADGHVALGLSLPQRRQWLFGWRGGWQEGHKLCSLSGLVTGTDETRQEGDTPRGGTAVGTGIFAHRRCSSPTCGTREPCQGPDLVGKGNWVLQAASTWAWVPGFGLVGDACRRTRGGPWQGVTAAGCSPDPPLSLPRWCLAFPELLISASSCT